MAASNKYDCIVVGGGHNGLTAAGYLQRAGLNTLVIERRNIVGGACVTEEAFPGYKVSTTSYVCSLLRPEIIRDLELPKFGYEIIQRNPSSFTPFPDGRSLMFWKDQKKTIEEIAKFSKKDAAAYPIFEKKIEELAAFVQPLLTMVPPDPSSGSLKNVMGSLKMLLKVKGLGSDIYEQLRVFSMSVADYLDMWFESPQLKSRLATDGVIGAWAGPCSPGTAYVLFHHVMGETDGQQGVWGYVRGGMGTITQAMAKSFESKGGTILTGASVEKIVVKDGIATGVVLTDGREYHAKRVISNADPHRTFIQMVGATNLPDDFVAGINNIRYRSGVTKINLGLGELPDFTAMPGKTVGPQHKGTIHIAPSMEYMERAFDDAKHGMPSENPVIEMTIPSTVDDTLAPKGKYVASLFTQYTPFERKDGKPWNKETKDAYAKRCFEIINEYAPNFKASVEHFQVLTPVDLQNEYGLTGGNLFHGEMTLDQLFFMRPIAKHADFRTPIKNLFLCGSGCHPGGGIMGSPGLIASRLVKQDMKFGGAWLN